MMLQKQVLSLPIIGGLSQKDDKVLSMRPRVMTNCVYRKSGSISKRYGYDCIGEDNYGFELDGSTRQLAPAEHLTPFDDELVRIGGGRLHSYGKNNISPGVDTDWIARGEVSEVLCEKATVSSTTRASAAASPSIAVSGSFIITAYNQSGVVVDVTDANTGTRLLGAKAVASTGGLPNYVKVVASGDYAFIVWLDSAAGFLMGCFLQLSTLTFGAVRRASTTLAGTAQFDVAAVGANEFALLYVTSGGVLLRAITRAFSGPSFVTVSAGVFLEATTNALRLSLSYAPGERFWCAWTWTDGVVTPYVRVRTATTGYSIESTAFTPAFGQSVNDLLYPTIARISPLRAALLINGLNTAADGIGGFYGRFPSMLYGEIALALPATLSTVTLRYLDQFAALSRPFRQGEQVYVHGYVTHSVASTPSLVDLYMSDTSGNLPALPPSGPRLAAVAMPRSLGKTATYVFGDTFNQFVRDGFSDVPALSSTERIAIQLAAVDGNATYDVFGLRMSWTWARTSAQVGNLLLIGGGAVTAFDGVTSCEVGYVHEPDSVTRPDLFPGTSGAMTAGMTYGYSYVFVWRDARGNVYRSAPSALKSIVLFSSQHSVTMVLPELALTNKGSLSVEETPQIEIYRTSGNGGISTLTLLATRQRDRSATMYTLYTDTAADTAIAGNRGIYSISAVDHVIPDGGNLVLAWRGGAILSGTSEGSVWFSGGKVEDEEVWWNDSLTQPTFEGGPVTALAALDASLILFKASSTFLLEGDPPADNGASSIGAPRQVQTDAGCADPASVVSLAQGIARKAATGFYLLGRNLVDMPLKGVEDAYRGAIVGAGILPAQGLVRWLQSGTGGADGLALDTFHWSTLGVPVWSLDTLYDARADAAAQPVACTMWRGAFVWVSGAGYLYRESTTNFSDVSDRIGRNVWVSMAFETGCEKPAGISAFQRVWRALVTAESVSPHDVSVTVTTERGSEPARLWTAAEIAAFPSAPLERLSVHVAEQKCQWMSVRVTDAQPAAPSGNRGGFVLRDVSLELAVKPGGMRVPAANRR